MDWFYSKGDFIGKLELLEKTTIKEGATKRNRPAWVCKCHMCNKVEVITVPSLKTRKLKEEAACYECSKKIGQARAAKKATTHHMTGTRIHGIWKNIKGRCSGKSSEYNNEMYYGRGIRVCDEWSKSFEAFHKWAIENGYKDNLEIDRIDNDGGYRPDNCRWVTHQKNCWNRPQYGGYKA